ncbi:MAG: hypothetical protein Q8R00_03665 [Candidatus Nanoarchaeia archaeon]|nr:hypothetical protein [Candidatus Nanoarchaeia archaeon]
MDKKGMQFETVVKWMIVLIVLLAVIFIFSTQFRSQTQKLSELRENVIPEDLPPLDIEPMAIFLLIPTITFINTLKLRIYDE